MKVVQLNNPSSAKVGAAAEPLKRARQKASADELKYAGQISPEAAWKLFISGQAHLVDVRAVEERKFVGHVPNTFHVAWQIGPSPEANPRFLCELENKLSKDAVILLLCRSGKHSAAAAEAATAAGFKQVFNVLEGVEGNLDAGPQRGTSGWRQRGLPWLQD